MHVVFGAGGRAGGATARALIRLSEAVRVVVRRPEQAAEWGKAGADVAIASIEDVDAVTKALQGAAAAFLLSPPPVAGDTYQRAAEIGAALAEGVRRASLPKAVVLSSVGAQHASGTGVIATLHQTESALAGTAPAVAFLRPGYFVETWSEVAGMVVAEGILPTFVDPDFKFPMVSAVDVGRAAANLMREHWAGDRVVELTGPEDWSARDVAAAFGKAIGRPVEPAFVPVEQRAAMLADNGVPEAVAAALLGMYDGISSGRVAPDQTAEHRRGTVPLTTAVERIVADHR
ncbi:MAG TPA: NmrA family NAD(P)-binding protein [Sphingomicrobium sp.]